MTRKAIGKQLTYLRRDLDAVDGKLSLGKPLTMRQMERLDTIRAIYGQQKYVYDNRTHSVPDRIVSVSRPFIRPIVRGKAGKPVEFGAKLDISVVDGWTRLECCSFDAYNEDGNLKEMAERFRDREGHCHSRIRADKICRNRENLSYCKEHGIRLSGPALGRPRMGETRNKAQDSRDECERVEGERRFSMVKRKSVMGLVTAKLRETAAHVLAVFVLVLNLRKIQRALLRLLTYLLAIFFPKEKSPIVQ
ncbi:MAG: transposase [Clostridiales bacterium]|nr:transposase [Clostridiales bacterium]